MVKKVLIIQQLNIIKEEFTKELMMKLLDLINTLTFNKNKIQNSQHKRKGFSIKLSKMENIKQNLKDQVLYNRLRQDIKLKLNNSPNTIKKETGQKTFKSKSELNIHHKSVECKTESEKKFVDTNQVIQA